MNSYIQNKSDIFNKNKMHRYLSINNKQKHLAIDTWICNIVCAVVLQNFILLKE